MLKAKDGITIYISVNPTDMRKSINGLTACAADDFPSGPQSGDIYVFWNRSRNKIKLLFWDKNGFVVYYKRLERGRFKLPQNIDETEWVVTHDQLTWLLAGLDFVLMDMHSELNYSGYY